MVSWTPPGGKRERRYFAKRTEANTEAETIREQQRTAGEVWLVLTADQRNEVIGILNDCQKEGFTLRQAVDYYRDNRNRPRVPDKLLMRSTKSPCDANRSQRIYMKSMLLILPALAILGCATTDPNSLLTSEELQRRRDLDEYLKKPIEFKWKPLHIGMTKDEVQQAWTTPEHTGATVTVYGTTEYWHYGSTLLVFEGGKLAAIHY